MPGLIPFTDDDDVCGCFGTRSLFECRCIQTYSPDKIGVAVGNDPVTQSSIAVERAGGGDEHTQPARFKFADTLGYKIVVDVEFCRQVFVERIVYFDRPERHVRNDQVVPIIGDALLFETLNLYGCIRIERTQDASGNLVYLYSRKVGFCTQRGRHKPEKVPDTCRGFQHGATGESKPFDHIPDGRYNLGRCVE